MKNSTISLLVHFAFGLIFLLIGFVNTFWGNDPFFGLMIILLSVLFFLPLINLILDKIAPRIRLVFKILIGLFILISSLGVGELFDKIEIMKSNFPLPKYQSSVTADTHQPQ